MSHERLWDETSTDDLPLEGFKVIDLARGLGGPFAATLLADFGAEVIKVEEPGSGDFMRHWGPANGIYWMSIARGKRSIAIDLKRPEAERVMQRLVTWADAMVESFRPGVLERLGFGPDRLHEWNPNLIVLRVSGYGQTGPNRELPGFGKAAEAYAGLADLTGFADGSPVHAGFPLADMTSGLMGAFGILVSSVARYTGRARGQVIDLALFETILRLMDYPVPFYSSTGTLPVRKGNHQASGASMSNVFRTKDDRWVTYSAGTDQVARRVLAMVGGEGLANDPRFNSLRDMCQYESEIDKYIENWMGERTAAQAVEQFAAANAVAAIVQTAADIVTDAHIEARDDLIEFPDIVAAKFVAPVPKLTKTPGRVRHLGPKQIGQDGEAILKQVLRFSPDEIEELTMAGAVVLPATRAASVTGNS